MFTLQEYIIQMSTYNLVLYNIHNCTMTACTHAPPRHMYRVCTCSATSTHIYIHMHIHRNLARAPPYVRLGPRRLNTAPSDLSPHVYTYSTTCTHPILKGYIIQVPT